MGTSCWPEFALGYVSTTLGSFDHTYQVRASFFFCHLLSSAPEAKSDHKESCTSTTMEWKMHHYHSIGSLDLLCGEERML